MLNKINSNDLGKGDHQGLDTKYHFSFANYYNADNINFGDLRVINDDTIDPQIGFDLHPHRDMEIITYIIDGELTHKDNLGNEGTVGKGNIQYISAGTGVYHSEENLSDNKLRLLQIWIYPDKKGYSPSYGDHKFEWEERKNEWLHMISPQNGEAPIKINQDANIYALELEAGGSIEFEVAKNRQAYLVQIDGESVINSIQLNRADALTSVEESLSINAKSLSHILVIELKKA